MTEVLHDLISRLELSSGPIFRADEVARWPKGTLDALVESGLLRETERARCVAYDGCDEGCIVEPEILEDKRSGKSVAAIWCWNEGCGGMITLDMACLRQWEICLEIFVNRLAGGLDLNGSVEPLVPARLWLLGTLPTGVGPLDIFFGRGLSWNDAASVIDRAGRLRVSTGPVVILPRRTQYSFPPLRPTLLSLQEHTTWNEGLWPIGFAPLLLGIRSLRPPRDETAWITVKQCAELLINDLPYLDVKRAMARVSKAASAGKFATNGRRGEARGIDQTSFDAWRLEQRDRDLNRQERQHFGDNL